jgi:hypothetical protein
MVVVGCILRMLVFTAALPIVIVAIDRSAAEMTCELTADKLVYAYSPQRRQNDANDTCVARFVVNVQLPSLEHSRSVCTGRYETLDLECQYHLIKRGTSLTVRGKHLTVADLNKRAHDTDTFSMCITKLGIEKMLLFDESTVNLKFAVTYTPRYGEPCDKVYYRDCLQTTEWYDLSMTNRARMRRQFAATTTASFRRLITAHSFCTPMRLTPT